jgi:hypothetical protein
MKILFFLSFLTLSVKAEIFKIPKGNHYSQPLVTNIFLGSKMEMVVTFDESAIYSLGTYHPDQGDVNKIYGFSDCKSNHSRNSARLGWRWYRDQLEIFAFTHRDGSLYPEFMTTAEINRPYKASIKISPDKTKYIYNFNGVILQAERGCLHAKAQGYHLRPYFGGQQTAPHDISLSVKLTEKFAPVLIDQPFPNPVRNGRFSFKVSAYESIRLYVNMYDITGRLIYKSPQHSLGIGENQLVDFELNKKYSSGIYLIMPVILMNDGQELKANLSNQSEEQAFRLLIL